MALWLGHFSFFSCAWLGLAWWLRPWLASDWLRLALAGWGWPWPTGVGPGWLGLALAAHTARTHKTHTTPHLNEVEPGCVLSKLTLGVDTRLLEPPPLELVLLRPQFLAPPPRPSRPPRPAHRYAALIRRRLVTLLLAELAGATSRSCWADKFTTRPANFWDCGE